MITDAELYFSDGQAVTADAGSTNVLDLQANRYLFEGKPMAVVVIPKVSADFTTTDETYSFVLQTDDNSTFTSPTSLSTQVVSAANLAAGKQTVLSFPTSANCERYIRLYYDVGGTTPSITVTAFLQPLDMVSSVRHYNDNITIS